MKKHNKNEKEANNLEIWTKVKNRLRKELGETLYRSWLKPLKLKKINNNSIIFSAETSLIRDRVERQYSERLISIWASEKPGIKKIEVSLDDNKNLKKNNINKSSKNPPEANQVSYKNPDISSLRPSKEDDILMSLLDKKLTLKICSRCPNTSA
jgi:ATPase involved in DNA replication initiation